MLASVSRIFTQRTIGQTLPSDFQGKFAFCAMARSKDEVIIRPLCKEDINNGFFEVLSQLTEAPALTAEKFEQVLERQEKLGIRLTLVAVDDSSRKVVGTGSAMIEHKFIRGGRPHGHIEDVVVDENERGRHVGLQLINGLVNFCDTNECYKVTLDCSFHNISFYERCGLKKMGQQMGKYFPVKE